MMTCAGTGYRYQRQWVIHYLTFKRNENVEENGKIDNSVQVHFRMQNVGVE